MNWESFAATSLRGAVRRSESSDRSRVFEPSGPDKSSLECQYAALMVSSLDIPLLLMDARGHDRWRNSAAARLVEADHVTWHRTLAAAVAAILHGGRSSDVVMRSVSTVHVNQVKYVVRGCELPTRDRPAVVALQIQRVCLIHRAPDALRDRYGLTERETRVAALMAEGYSDAEIGRRLSISPHTARSHAERVRRKLHVRSRAQVNRALITEWTGNEDV